MNDVSGYSVSAFPRGLVAAFLRAPLRGALFLDAAVTGVNGLAYLAAGGPLSELLGLSAPLLRGVGAVLLAFACVVWFVAVRPTIARPAVHVIVAINAVWALGSLVVAVAAWGSPTTAGTVWIVLQAIVVAGFVELQLVMLKKASR